MRFRLGAVPESLDFVPDMEWKPLREPTPWVAQLIALPLGCGCFVLFGMLWLHLTDLNVEQFGSDVFIFIGFLLFIPLIVVHELIHALFHPQSGKSDHSILGFWPSKLLFYAHYDGDLTRRRFVTILVMPMMSLSILPFLVAVVTGHANGYVAWISTWNTLFACLDMLGIILLCFQVPHNATCRNQGWKTYWKLDCK
jgi:hypothetical protein